MAATFAEVFKRIRVAEGLSHAKVASMVGVDKETVRAWEEQAAIPERGNVARRIKAVMPRLKPYLRALYDRPDAAATDPLGEVPPLVTKRVEQPGHFGSHLKAERLREGLDQLDVGELVGVTDQAVAYWEADRNIPVRENFDRLVQIFPALERWELKPRDIPKPVGQGPHPAPPREEPFAIVSHVSAGPVPPQFGKAIIVGREREDAIAAAEAWGTAVRQHDDLVVALGEARDALENAQAAVDRLNGRVMDAKRAVEAREIAAREAWAALAGKAGT